MPGVANWLRQAMRAAARMERKRNPGLLPSGGINPAFRFAPCGLRKLKGAKTFGFGAYNVSRRPSPRLTAAERAPPNSSRSKRKTGMKRPFRESIHHELLVLLIVAACCLRVFVCFQHNPMDYLF